MKVKIMKEKNKLSKKPKLLPSLLKSIINKDKKIKEKLI